VPLTLRTLADAFDAAAVAGSADVPITDLAYDSRAVRPGALFFCRPGARADGHDFAADAVAAGAAALVVERRLPDAVPQVLVPSTARAMGPMASAFYGHPSRAFELIAVTGTNGKTTTSFMIESVARAMGRTSGLLGTVEGHIADRVVTGSRTTPESVDLQRTLAAMRDAGVRTAVMEVSSHGLALHRVDGTRYACAVFTNLTQDHLDDHGTMEAYFAAKAMLFTPAFTPVAVLGIDDPYARRLADMVRVPSVGFALDRAADVRARSIEVAPAGSAVVADVRGERVELRVPLPGRYNVTNALGVLATGAAMRWPIDRVVAGIESLPGVPGRMERIEAGQPFTVLVDYAHTPDALAGVLRAARELTGDGARLVAVFGCGGDRDRGKRPLMGAVATSLADLTVITSDNPRSEDPTSIIAEIEHGVPDGGAYTTEPDRRAAIAQAIAAAHAGDVVVIAGKGHEQGQEFAGRTIEFDDRMVAREILEAR